MRLRRAQLVVAAVAAVAACGDSGDPGPDGGVYDVPVPAGTFVEADFYMSPDSAVTAAFDSGDVSLSWDVHIHVGDQVEVLDEGTSRADTVRFQAPEYGGYSFYWENLATFNATLHVELTSEGDVSFVGWYP